MTLIDNPVELTTAATDILLAITAWATSIYLWLHRDESRWRSGLWCSILVTTGAAALLGAIAHGTTLSDQIYIAVWSLIFLALSIPVALFVVALVLDVYGVGSAKRFMPIALAIAACFFAYTLIEPDDFRPFIVYEILSLILALAGYLWLTWKRTLPGAGLMASAITLMLGGSLVQASGIGVFTLVWPFDHNSIFHLIQTAAIPLLATGIRSGMRTA